MQAREQDSDPKSSKTFPKEAAQRFLSRIRESNKNLMRESRCSRRKIRMKRSDE